MDYGQTKSVKTTAAASSRNDNIPGDGKFDNNIFPCQSAIYKSEG
jgi:hypothetical protein